MPRPPGSTFWQALFCIALGAAGGFVFNLFNLPLAFMLGAIAATMVAGIAGIGIARPNRHLVTPMRAALGVLLGSAVTPELLDRVAALGAAAAIVPVFVLISGVAGMIYYTRIAGFTKEEAFFCALPGGLHAMTIYAEDCGVDIRRVALAHALRITFVVTIIPFTVGLLTTMPVINAMTISHSFADTPADDLVILFLAGVVGWWLGEKTRMPGAAMLGPMVASAALHIGGVTAAKPPFELIIASQIVIGASIGARYIGETFEIVRLAVIYAAGYVVITLLIAALFAFGLHFIFGLPVVTGLLSFAPGGMSELGLIALGLGLDVGFVATIQVSRLTTIAFLAPWAFRYIRSYLKA